MCDWYLIFAMTVANCVTLAYVYNTLFVYITFFVEMNIKK